MSIADVDEFDLDIRFEVLAPPSRSTRGQSVYADVYTESCASTCADPECDAGTESCASTCADPECAGGGGDPGTDTCGTCGACSSEGEPECDQELYARPLERRAR